MPEVIDIPRRDNPFPMTGRGANVTDTALPRNAGGKLLKARLRDQVQWGEPLR